MSSQSLTRLFCQNLKPVQGQVRLVLDHIHIGANYMGCSLVNLKTNWCTYNLCAVAGAALLLVTRSEARMSGRDTTLRNSPHPYSTSICASNLLGVGWEEITEILITCSWLQCLEYRSLGIDPGWQTLDNHAFNAKNAAWAWILETLAKNAIMKMKGVPMVSRSTWRNFDRDSIAGGRGGFVTGMVPRWNTRPVNYLDKEEVCLKRNKLPHRSRPLYNVDLIIREVIYNRGADCKRQKYPELHHVLHHCH